MAELTCRLLRWLAVSCALAPAPEGRAASYANIVAVKVGVYPLLISGNNRIQHPVRLRVWNNKPDPRQEDRTVRFLSNKIAHVHLEARGDI